jgi:uncharacterized glyoxalase superfamily protein PhnB
MAAHPSVSPAIVYRDPKAALPWLERAFGFKTTMMIHDADGNLVHSQMQVGDGLIMVGTAWSADHAYPASVGGKNTQTVHVHVDDDVDAHCARARAGGAQIVAEPEDQFYGERCYRAKDLEGHLWTFSKTVKALTPEQWDAAMPGFKTVVFKPD